MGIVDYKGYVIVKYSYDAYGNILSINDKSNFGLESLNPFRYKVYYYDNGTGLYYLFSRSCDLETGRFISPDSIDYLEPSKINCLNLYAYCENDPTNKFDPTEHFAIELILLTFSLTELLILGAVLAVLATFKNILGGLNNV